MSLAEKSQSLCSQHSFFTTFSTFLFNRKTFRVKISSEFMEIKTLTSNVYIFNNAGQCGFTVVKVLETCVTIFSFQNYALVK